MSSVVIAGDTSGTITLQAPSVAGTTTINLPAVSGNLLTSASSIAASSLTGTVSIAQGGTNNGSLAVTAGGVVYTDGSKLVNVGAGTAGYYLQSNGASAPTWTAVSGGVTSLNGQTGAITNTDLYAIGSYVLGRPKNTTTYSVNSTIAGSILYTVPGDVHYVAAAVNNFAVINTGGTSGFTQTLVNTGTWRAMATADGSTYYGSVLWVRIS